MYQFKEEIDYRGHFWFDKKLIENKNWAVLDQASKSVFPVIACHRNQKGEAFPGEQTIAILSGRSDKTVRNGIRGLEAFPCIKYFDYVTRRGRRSKKFSVSNPPEEKGRAFPFYKSVLEGGNWSLLPPSAQALYPVMRYYGYFDTEILEIYDEDGKYGLYDFNEAYKERTWDFCEADPSILAEYAGIHQRSVRVALKSLEDYCLAERYSDEYRNGWKIFLHPRRHYKRSYLNNRGKSIFRNALYFSR